MSAATATQYGYGTGFYNHFNMQPGKKDLVAGDIPTIFPNQIFDQIKMDGTKVLLTRHVLERRNTSVKLIVFKKATAINIW